MVLGPTPVKRLLTEQLAVSCWSLVLYIYIFYCRLSGFFHSTQTHTEVRIFLHSLARLLVSEKIKEEGDKVMLPHGGHQS